MRCVQAWAAVLARQWRHRLEDIRCLLPGECLLCGRSAQRGMCDACEQQLRASVAGLRCTTCGMRVAQLGVCAACRRSPAAYERLLLGMAYLPPGDSVIREFKQAGRLLYGDVLARLLVGAWQQAMQSGCPLPRQAWVIAIPASRGAAQRRGFNPAGLIAAGVAKALDMPLQRGVLRWQEAMPDVSQRGRSRQQRLQRGAERFQVVPGVGWQEAPAIVVVDDVITTGATLRAAALALRQAGSGPVWALAVAGTPPSRESRKMTS